MSVLNLILDALSYLSENFFNIIVLYMYIFFLSHMNKITARAIACFKGRDTSNKTQITLNFNEIHVR